ncbi:hypothetical protein [Hoeflea sp.]|uniref:hypothetical protein n=1 Tax=Hoeflea sp. TaxID=1940281 RepID=UPI003A91A740
MSRDGFFSAAPAEKAGKSKAIPKPATVMAMAMARAEFARDCETTEKTAITIAAISTASDAKT